jgi:alpha-N-acetylglucosamine transferase
MKVLCLKWGTQYSAKYVNVLNNSIKRVTPDAELYCLTDNADNIAADVHIIELEDTGLKGWWNKLKVFDVDLGEPVLYLDLDVLIQQDITPFFEYKPELDFVGIENFSPKAKQINSSVMRIAPHTHSFNTTDMHFGPGGVEYHNKWGNYGEYIGDQELINDTLFPDNNYKGHVFPKDWVESFKYNGKQYHRWNKIVVFHGNPKPHECEGWVEDYWKL